MLDLLNQKFHQKKGWIGSANFTFSPQNTSRRPLTVSSETVPSRCFKEYFSKYIYKFHKKTSVVDYNFTINMQLKSTTSLKLYPKLVISQEIFGIPKKATLRYFTLVNATALTSRKNFPANSFFSISSWFIATSFIDTKIISERHELSWWVSI